MSAYSWTRPNERGWYAVTFDMDESPVLRYWAESFWSFTSAGLPRDHIEPMPIDVGPRYSAVPPVDVCRFEGPGWYEVSIENGMPVGRYLAWPPRESTQIVARLVPVKEEK